ncbi:MAG: hypothetical protein LBQ13_05040 [Endomicrobium sp.]|jgi:hypothetical protein|nr:hypothetical protein [Endomicrobium sp.]
MKGANLAVNIIKNNNDATSNFSGHAASVINTDIINVESLDNLKLDDKTSKLKVLLRIERFDKKSLWDF